MPLSLAAMMGIFMQYLPSPIITYDQVKLLRQDNVVSEKQNTLESIGVANFHSETNKSYKSRKKKTY